MVENSICNRPSFGHTKSKNDQGGLPYGSRGSREVPGGVVHESRRPIWGCFRSTRDSDEVRSDRRVPALLSHQLKRSLKPGIWALYGVVKAFLETVYRQAHQRLFIMVPCSSS